MDDDEAEYTVERLLQMKKEHEARHKGPPPVDKATAEKYGVKEGTALITWDFVLVSDKEADELRDRKSMEALEKLGRHVKIVDGLPVPDVD